MRSKPLPLLAFAFTAALELLSTQFAAATDGTWTANTSSTWSTPGSWLSGIADGAGAVADFSTLNISNNRTVTIDGIVASRTVGILLLGDTDALSSYTIAASGGGTLTFDNGA